MDIRVNGATRQVSAATTVGDLLRQLDLDLNGVAVAVNHMVLPRSGTTEHVLAKGDEIEIIRAVGGG